MISPLATFDLSRSFGDERAVDGVTLEVRPGEIHAIVGLNGAGKTTLMRLLLGMLRPDSGRATVFGCDAHDAPSASWSKVGHLIENPSAYPELTVRENLFAAAILHGMAIEAVATEVRRVIDHFGLLHWAERRAGTLSLGNKQRLALASALLHQPPVVVLDEPANALDPAGVVFTRDLLRDFARRDAAVLVSSHHFDQLARVADRISVMHRGRVVGSLDPGGIDLEQAFFDMVRQYDLDAGAMSR